MAGSPAAYTNPQYGSEGGFRSERNQRKKGLNREFAVIVEPSNGLKRDIPMEAPPIPADPLSRVPKLLEALPNDDYENRPEETRTLKLRGLFRHQSRAAVVYSELDNNIF
jgi:hypothetical protein